MDTHIGDLHSLIVDREIELVQELLEEILVHVKNMNDACDILAELDCLLSFADAAITYGYVRPTMVEAGIIEIHQGRCVPVLLRGFHIPTWRHSKTSTSRVDCRHIHSQRC
jgi:DNA mismatch repair ATPase MutS